MTPRAPSSATRCSPNSPPTPPKSNGPEPPLPAPTPTLVQTLLEIEGIPNMGELDNVEAPYIADALLPVVDRLANQRAAAELRAAADEIEATDWPSARVLIRYRADRLDPSS